MAFFIQYNEQGNIGATVLGDRAPLHPRQLVFEEWFETTNLKVDVATGQLVEKEPEPDLAG